MKTNRRGALIVVFSIILPICAIITALLLPTSSSAVTETATEDIGMWSACPGRIRWENIIASLMLLFMGIYLLELIIARWFKFAIARKQTRAFQSEIAEAIYNNHFFEAFDISAKYKKSPLAFVTAASLQSDLSSYIENKAIKPSMYERQRAIVIESADIKRRLWTLAAIGWSAPLVGLIFALIDILQAVMAISDTGGTALYIFADQFISAIFHLFWGLAIAVPAIWAHKYFSSQVETFALEMDKLSLAIIGQIADHQRRSFQRETKNQFITHRLDARPTQCIAD